MRSSAWSPSCSVSAGTPLAGDDVLAIARVVVVAGERVTSHELLPLLRELLLRELLLRELQLLLRELQLLLRELQLLLRELQLDDDGLLRELQLLLRELQLEDGLLEY